MGEGSSRRAFLKATLLGIAAGGGALTVHQNVGYALPGSVALKVLSAKEGAVLAAATRRILAGTVDLTDALLADVVSWLDGYLSRQPSWTQQEVKALLQALEHGPPILSLQFSRFTRLSPEGQDRCLRAWGDHPLPLCRQGYLGLKGMVFLAGYRRADLLRAIGYDGPPYA